MTPELQAELLKIVNGIREGATTVFDVLKTEIPDILQQLLLWHGVQSFVFFVLAIIMLIAVPVLVWYVLRYWKNWRNIEEYNDKEFYEGVGIAKTIMSVCAAVGCLAGGLGYVNIEWLKIWIAPKVWLLEYITTMIK